ncbi:MAG: HPr family phosphocarrier protein [Tessaracoccus sp.]
MISRTAVVTDPQGIHAMVAHRLCQTAEDFSSSIWLMVAGQRCSLVNPISILAMGITSGTEVMVLADGIDEAEALEAVCLQLGETV